MIYKQVYKTLPVQGRKNWVSVRLAAALVGVSYVYVYSILKTSDLVEGIRVKRYTKKGSFGNGDKLYVNFPQLRRYLSGTKTAARARRGTPQTLLAISSKKA